MASNKNQATIEGNMVRDPMLRTTNSGVSICNFSIASNRYYKRGDEFEKETSYFDIQCWAGLAMDVNDRGKKGSSVMVTGRLKQERWTDREGKNQNKIIIVAESVQLISRQSNSQRQDNYADDCPF